MDTVSIEYLMSRGHVRYCRVCIDEFDHHCPWIGKCVGGGNVTDFYVFLAVCVASSAYIAIVTGIYFSHIP